MIIEQKKLKYIIPVLMLLVTLVIYCGVIPIYEGYTKPTLVGWTTGAWNPQTEYQHGWAIPILFVVCVFVAWKPMASERVNTSRVGGIVTLIGIAFFIIAARTLQPRVALFGMPFLIYGGVRYVWGKEVAKHMLFPSFMIWFAIPLPGLQQATNGLQLIVSKSCYVMGSGLGMKLHIEGNTISSAINTWEGFDIAEGCSGVRSLMALMMISAIYAHYTQRKLWKKMFLFSCSIPIAILMNIVRIFSMLVLAEMGYADFAAGVYHDWTGLIVFFPLALLMLFTLDKMINRGKKKIKRVKTVK